MLDLGNHHMAYGECSNLTARQSSYSNLAFGALDMTAVLATQELLLSRACDSQACAIAYGVAHCQCQPSPAQPTAEILFFEVRHASLSAQGAVCMVPRLAIHVDMLQLNNSVRKSYFRMI